MFKEIVVFVKESSLTFFNEYFLKKQQKITPPTHSSGKSPVTDWNKLDESKVIADLTRHTQKMNAKYGVDVNPPQVKVDVKAKTKGTIVCAVCQTSCK